MKKKINECPEIPYFGATYPDARCIDGYLWDLDSHTHNDGDMQYFSSGGDDPCPFCNTDNFIQDNENEELSKDEILKWIEEMRAKYGH